MGVIEGIKKGAQSSIFRIQGKVIMGDLRLGDSVAVNGVCLTVSTCSKNTFTADVMHETLTRCTLGSLGNGSHVNLERAMPACGRFGGHIVSGHIDGTGMISKTSKDDNAIWYTVHAAESIMKYIVEKGSIAMDGISLTVAKVTSDHFSVSVIPHTAKVTILSEKRVGDAVNLENDMVGKYIEKLMRYGQAEKPQSVITKDFLTRAGY